MSKEQWRQYGGVNQFDSFNNLNINTITANTITLKSGHFGNYSVFGDFYVSGNVHNAQNQTQDGSMNILGNLTVGKDVSLNKSIHVKENIFIGMEDGSGSAFVCSSKKNIGINNATPLFVLDISGNNSQSFGVFSNNNLNTNILSQNKDKHGMVVSCENDYSSISFFNNHSIDLSNGHMLQSPDATITYVGGGGVGGGHLDISTNINNLHSSNNTNIFSLKNTNITSNDQYNVDASSISMNANTTIINSSLSISNQPNKKEHMKNEEVIIYDISNGSYLYDVYENTNHTTGNALSLVSNNNNSNTFLNILTPSGKGMGIVGGVLPQQQLTNPSSKSMLSMGIFDQSSNYIPSQIIVEGNNLIKRTTIGINTHHPFTDNNVLQVNGPMVITNGEILDVYNVPFQITKMSISSNSSKAISIGTPTIVYDVSNNLYHYKAQILLSDDGGGTWRVSNGFYNKNKIFLSEYVDNLSNTLTSLHYYNETTCIIGGEKGFCCVSHVSEDNITTFHQIDVGETSNTIDNIKIFKKQSSASQTNSYDKQIIVIYTTTNTDNSLKIKFFQMDNINVFNQIIQSNGSAIFMDDSNNCTNVHNYYHNDGANNIYPIKAFDGNDSYVFFAGNGIEKVMFNQHSSVTTTNNPNNNIETLTHGFYYQSQQPANIYNEVKTLKGTNFTIFVGNNIISYTEDGNNIHDVFGYIDENYTDALFTNTTFKDVFIFDINNAITITTQNQFFVTQDGAKTWVIINPNYLNTSGNANVLHINDERNYLTNIFFKDKQTFVVSSTINSYNDNVQPKINGFSKIYQCYFPDIFDSLNNTVLNVDGNMKITGSIDAFKDVVIYSNITVLKDTILYGNVGILKNTSVIGNLDIYDNLTAHSNTYLQDDVSMNKNADISGNLNIYNNLVAHSNTFLNENVWMNKNTDISGNLNIHNNLVAHSNTYLQGNVLINKNADISGNLVVKQTAKITGNMEFENDVLLSKLNASLTIINDGYIFCETYESPTTNIKIGAGGGKIIQIGGGTPGEDPNTITIGNSSNSDQIIIHSKNYKVVGNISYGTNKMQLNDEINGDGVSQFGGLFIRDYDKNEAGYIIVNENIDGWLMKAPNHPNIIDINCKNLNLEEKYDMYTNQPIDTGLVVFKKNTNPFPDSSYVLQTVPFDVSNIFLKDHQSPETSKDFLQTITSNVKINGDVLLQKEVGINGNANIEGTMFCKNTTNPTTFLNDKASLVVSGGVVIKQDTFMKNVNVTGNVTTSSTTTTSELNVSGNAKITCLGLNTDFNANYALTTNGNAKITSLGLNTDCTPNNTLTMNGSMFQTGGFITQW